MSVDVYNRICEIVALSNTNTKVKNARVGIDTLSVNTTMGEITFVHHEDNGWTMSDARVAGASCEHTLACALYKLMFDLARGLYVKPELRSRFGLTS